MNNKKIYLLKEGEWRNTLSIFSKKFGLPEISSSLGIYFVNGENEYELKFINSECFFKSNNKKSKVYKNLEKLFNDTPQIHVENKNIKFFLFTLKSLGLNNVYISEKVTNIKFKSQGNEIIDFNLNTPLGDLVVIRGLESERYISNKVIHKKMQSEEIGKVFKKNTNPEPLFNDMNILNNKIIKYADDFGIDLNSSGRSSIHNRLSGKSNDYSGYDDVYKNVIGSDLNYNLKNIKLMKGFFKPVSIIIPSYDSEDTLVEVLTSIESQDIDKKQKMLLDVIIVDDGSQKAVSQVLSKEKFTFDLNIVRLEKNKGLSSARNLGVTLAKYNNLLFIDSDILLSKNYLLEHSIVLQMFPTSLFISMKNNIDKESKIRNIDNIKKGLSVPIDFNDKRLLKTFKKEQPWINDINEDGICEVISETDCFKLFGNKKMVGGYDLSSMVVGHNMSVRKNLVNKAGGFSNSFVGWGVEDAYFGSRIIVSGGFIIPLLSTGVYHINHEPRSGNELKRQQEYKKNIDRYKKLINKEI